MKRILALVLLVCLPFAAAAGTLDVGSGAIVATGGGLDIGGGAINLNAGGSGGAVIGGSADGAGAIVAHGDTVSLGGGAIVAKSDRQVLDSDDAEVEIGNGAIVVTSDGRSVQVRNLGTAFQIRNAEQKEKAVAALIATNEVVVIESDDAQVGSVRFSPGSVQMGGLRLDLEPGSTFEVQTKSGETVQLRANAEAGSVEMTDGEFTVQSRNEIAVEGGELRAGNVVIKSPSEAMVDQSGVVDVSLELEGDAPVYVVRKQEEKRFLWLFKYQSKRTVKIHAGSAEIIAEQKGW